MISSSILNVFELEHFALLDGLRPVRSGYYKFSPKLHEKISISSEIRIAYFSSGKAVIKHKNNEVFIQANDVCFLFPDEEYILVTGSDSPCEIWWVDVQGSSVSRILDNMNISKRQPVIGGVTNPVFLREMKSLATYSDDRQLSDTMHIASGLMKVFAVLSDSCSNSQWLNIPYTDHSILYTGTWSTWPTREGKHHNEIYTSTSKAYAEYNFHGTGIRWYGTMNFDCGKADVIIDGIYHTTIDTYSPERLADQLLYSNTKLSLGHHIFKIFCTGNKNSQATNCDVVISSLQYISSNEAPINQSASFGICKKATEIIKVNFASDISIEKLAKQLNVSQSYLNSRFKSELGMSVGNYIREVRISKAKHLLQTSELPIHDISLKVGFPDAFYFSRVFKAVENITPSQYRVMYKN